METSLKNLIEQYADHQFKVGDLVICSDTIHGGQHNFWCVGRLSKIVSTPHDVTSIRHFYVEGYDNYFWYAIPYEENKHLISGRDKTICALPAEQYKDYMFLLEKAITRDTTNEIDNIYE